MGYLSCSAESAISTCDSVNWQNLSGKKKKGAGGAPAKVEVRGFCFSDLETATNGFSDSNFLGKGSHGSVYKAVLDGGALVAAVKRTNVQRVAEDERSPVPAENEIETLSRVRSPRFVNLFGFGSDPADGRKLIVVEFMPNGSLFDLLHGAGRKPAGLRNRVRIAVQVAKAVQHLHGSNPPVIHRDIKSSNVLFDGKWNARLGDFGLALRGHVEDVKVRRTPPAGTLGYLDPCYLSPADLTAKSDVFSFGILLLEIISGRNAIDLKYSPPSVVDWAVPIIRSGDYSQIIDPRIETAADESAVQQIAVLAARCVRSTAEKRPAMTEVVQCLLAVSKRLKSPVWNSFGRSRRRVRTPVPPSIKYQPLDENAEMVKLSSRRTGKVSGVTRADSDITVCHVARSKSIGSVHEIKPLPSDLSSAKRRGSGVGFSVKMPTVRMNRSRSTGALQGAKLENKIVLQVIRNPKVGELESTRLLLNFEKKSNKVLGQ